MNAFCCLIKCWLMKMRAIEIYRDGKENVKDHPVQSNLESQRFGGSRTNERETRIINLHSIKLKNHTHTHTKNKPTNHFRAKINKKKRRKIVDKMLKEAKTA